MRTNEYWFQDACGAHYELQLDIPNATSPLSSFVVGVHVQFAMEPLSHAVSMLDVSND